ncbi:MAG: hypothetical protein DMF50_04305 [Acidobacteria bacterium]|nr:MAG: hypothetical protein DMF50_04305 [Acidobacteriota bacterium]
MKRPEKIALAAVTLFLLPFCCAGVFLGVRAVRAATATAPDWKQTAFLAIGSLVFGGVGFVPFFLVRAGWSRWRAATRLKEEHPDAPWMWRDDWARGEVLSSGGPGVAALWFFVMLWNLISAPMLILLPAEVMKGNRPAALGFMFPLIGAGLLVHVSAQTLRRRKFGDSTLALAANPAAPGRRLLGTIRTHAVLQPEDGFHLTLTCVNRVTDRSGKETSVSEKILWRDERTMTRGMPDDDPARSAIPVSFVIPAEAAPTSGDDPDSRILWCLAVDAKVPGFDYHADFEVPVFKAPAGSAAAAAAFPATGFAATASAASASAAGPDPMADYEAPEMPYLPGSDPGVRVGPSESGGTEFYFGAARAPGAAAGMTVFTAIFWGTTWFLLYVGAPWIFPILFGAFCLLMTFLALDLWFGTTRVVFGEAEVRIRGSILGLGTMRSIPRSEIQDVRAEITMQSGGRSGTPYYAIKLVRRDGRKAGAGEYLRDKREALWLAGEMKKLVASSR